MQVHASAPTRVDLAGGTLDIWPLYLLHEDAQTLNAAVTIRAECRLAPHPGGRLRVVAEDTGARVEAAHWSELDESPALRLVSRVLRFFRAEGLAVSTRSAAPVGAGLAGSSALNVALCAALARWSGRSLAGEALIALARDLEAQVLGVPTGEQDYRPAVYGGAAALELRPGGVTRAPLRVDVEALASRIVLVYTGQSRDSGINNWEVTKRRLDGAPALVSLFDEIRDAALGMRQALEAARWDDAARHLALEWELRKRLAPGVTTARLDELIGCGRRAGADAAKVCGAGGGGCLLFLTPPGRAEAVRGALTAAGARVLACRIDTRGLEVRVTARERQQAAGRQQ